MTCERPCWEHTHRAGRCKCGTNASRAAIGLAPLPEDDTPIETPEHAEELARKVLGWAAFVGIAFGGVWAVAFLAGVK